MCHANLRRWPSLALALPALGALFAALPESWRIACEYDRQALAAGEAWRLWTAHFVHFSARHAGVDLIALTMLGIGVERCCGWCALAALFAFAPPLLSLALDCFVPDLDVYRGASALCAVFGVVLGAILWQERPALRATLLVLATAFALKLIVEAAGDAINFSGLAGGVRVVWQAHFGGVVIGASAVAVWRCFLRAVARSTPIQENRDVTRRPRLLA